MTETVTIRKDDLRLLMIWADREKLPSETVVPLNEALSRCGEALAQAESGSEESEATAPVYPPGELARLELPGFVAHVGWISEETFAGAGVLVVRDATGTVVARVSPNAYRQIIPLPVPRPGEARLAIAEAAGRSGDGCACEPGDEACGEVTCPGWRDQEPF